MNKTAMISGITGQDGSYLAELLLSKDYRVIGLKRRTSLINTDRIDHFYDHPNFTLEYFDLNDVGSMYRMLNVYRPDELYNLAAMSHVKVSFDIPEHTVDGIAMGTLRWLEALRNISPNTRFYQASSSEMYGDSFCPQDGYDENSRMSPVSPYACAKLFAHNLVRNYRESYGLHASSGILFNHECFFHNTPVLIKSKNEIDFVYISSLIQNRKNHEKDTAYHTKDFSNENIEIWDGKQFVLLKRVSRKKLNSLENRDRSRRIVVSAAGSVETTPNHKLVNSSSEKIPSRDMSIKNEVLIGSFPENLPPNKELTGSFAKLLGLLCGDGHAGPGRLSFSNNDEKITLEFERLLSLCFPGASISTRVNITEESVGNKFKGKSTQHIVSGLSQSNIRVLMEMLYDERTKHKKVPKAILNAALEIQEKFLEGYYLADGLKRGHGIYRFKSFKTNSALLAQGLLYLFSRVTGQMWNINTYEKSPGKVYYHINLRSDENVGDKGAHLKCVDHEIKKIIQFEEKNQHVYDIETASGVVMAGIGTMIVGNSPARGETFVTRKITLAAARIKFGLQERLELGNLNAFRDWGHARDYVRAMWLMLQQENPDDYVIASGETHSVKDFLKIVFNSAGLGDYNKYVTINKKYMRPQEVPFLLGNASKAREKLGWELKTSFKELAEEMFIEDYNYVRKNEVKDE